MEKRGQEVLKRFKAILVLEVNNSELLKIMRNLRHSPGDIVRTTLTSCSCEAVGGNPEKAFNASLVFALASAAIGMHDDIIDKSAKKHFSKTIFGLYGLEKALLVGDLLLVKAWSVASEMFRDCSEPGKIDPVIEAYRVSSIQLCEAEIAGISCRRRVDTDLRKYRNILWNINSDMEACAKIGGILGGGSMHEVKGLSEFGRRLGFMLGIVDDFRDSVNAEGNLISRLEFESVPLPILYAAQSSKDKYLATERILRKPSINAADAKVLLEFCGQSNAFRYVLEMAKRNMRRANSSISCLKPSDARNILVSIFGQSFAELVELCEIIGDLNA